MIKGNFLQIEAVTHPLSQLEKDALFNPPSLTSEIFKKAFNTDSQKVESLTEKMIDERLYKHADFLGLNDIGDGFPSPGPLLNYVSLQKQERLLEKALAK